MRVNSLLYVVFMLLMAGGVCAQVKTGSAYPKRDFRAAWIQSANGQFRGTPTEKLKQNLIGQLNSLQKARINAIIFQVRPEADALYASLSLIHICKKEALQRKRFEDDNKQH